MVTRRSSTAAPDDAHASTCRTCGSDFNVAANPSLTGALNHTQASLPYTSYALSIEAFTESEVLWAARNAAVASPIAPTVTRLRALRLARFRNAMAGILGSL